MAVDINSRGKSIGKKLIEHTLKYLQKNQYKSVNVATQMQNEIACNFYKKNNFTQESLTNIYHLWV